MSEFMPHYAPVVVLLFLGTVLLMGVSFLVLFYGAARRSSFFAGLGGGAALTMPLDISPLTTPLRPGESYTTDFAFDAPGMLASSGPPSRRTTQKPGWSSGTKTASFTRRFTLGLIPQHH